MKIFSHRILSSLFLFPNSVRNFREIRVEPRRHKGTLCSTKGHCDHVNSQWDPSKNPQDARIAVDLNGDASFTFLVLQRVQRETGFQGVTWSLFTVDTIRRFRFGGFEDIRKRNESVYNV